ncbi:MAG: tRNA lysidine(34) synthetase TilS [Clostridiales bacterium]|nr:tRNA lysidine(34) synthetase TilS [Clostridiales bacterium]
MFIERVQKNIIENNMIKRGETIAVAVSGGVDSTVLLFVLNALRDELGFNVAAVNVEHGIRGKESLSDSEFVRGFCEDNGIKFFGFSADIPSLAIKEGTSYEECARNKRYEIFEELLKSGKCDKVALAHHADDQAETIFMRIMRGTGIRGLSGMSYVRDGAFIRPLLDIKKSDIMLFASKNKIPYVTDGSNFEDAYTRNYIRNTIFPLLSERFDVTDALLRLSENAFGAVEYLDKCVDGLGIIYEKNAVKAPLKVFDEPILLNMTVIKCFKHLGVFKDIERRHVEELKKLSGVDNGGRLDMPFGIAAVKEYGYITFYIKEKDCAKTRELGFFDVLKVGECVFGEYKLELREYSNYESISDIKNFHIKKNKDGYAALVMDADRIPERAVRRTMKSGDEFKKFGGGTKKLCDYFTDIKIQKRLRTALPLIASENKILAVAGKEISDDVKIDKETKRRLICLLTML